MLEARSSGATRASRSPRPRFGRRIVRFLAAGLLAATSVAVTQRADDTSAAADEPVWVLVGTETNPTNDTEREGYTVSVSPTSLNVDVLIFPSDPSSTARVTSSATWEPFPDTLTPGQQLSLPITVESAPAAGAADGFFSELSVIALVDGGWNRDAVSAGASCTDQGGELVCSEPTSTTDTLDYSVPASGGTMRLGVGALNCGDTCRVDVVYELREPAPPTIEATPTTEPPSVTEPSTSTEPASDQPTDVVDIPDRRSALRRVSTEDLERFEALKAVWSVLADGALGGRTSVQSLELLRDLVDDYFGELIPQAVDDGDEALADALRRVHARELGLLETYIEQARERATQDALEIRSALLQQVLFGGAESVDPDALPDPRIDGVLDALRDRDDRSAFDAQLIGVGGDARDGEPNEFRTIRFTNLGSDAVTVRPFSYEPADDIEYPLPEASTVVFPDPNPSAALGLPRGTYVFCYDWDLGADGDGDGYGDERYALTAEVTIGKETPSEFDRAPVVTVDPSGGSPGSCPGSPEPGGGFTPTGFTPQEEAADGRHDYEMVCTYADGSTEVSDRSYRFVIGDTITEWWEDDDAGVVDLFWIDTNRYETADGTYEIVFTDGGFELVPLQPDGFACVATRRPR